MASTALLTDRYELTMLASALRDGSAGRHCVFELFARRLPDGRRYGVVAGTGRLLDAARSPSASSRDELAVAGAVSGVSTGRCWRRWPAGGSPRAMDGYREGELYFPGSPVLTVTGTFGEAVLLETLALSIFNHDSAVASAAARMVTAAGDRPLIEMGSRRTQEEAAVAAARAAYLAGFRSTSNLEAGRRYGIPTSGTAAHAFTLLHDSEAAAFKAQVETLGVGTTLLVDTYNIAQGIRTAVEVAGPELGAVRIDSGDLSVLARQAREPARLARRHRHPDRTVRRPGRVGVGGAGLGAGGRVRGRHLGGDRVRRADRGHGLELVRWTGAGGEAVEHKSH